MLLAARKLHFCRNIIRQRPIHVCAPCIILRFLAQVAPRAQEKNWQPPIFREAADDDVTASRDDSDLGFESEEHSSELRHKQIKTFGNAVTLGEDSLPDLLQPEYQKPQDKDDRDLGGNSTRNSASDHEHSASNSIGHHYTSSQEDDTKDKWPPTGSTLNQGPALPEAKVSFDNGMAVLRESLAANDPASLLHCLWNLSHNADFIANIPDVTFIELLRKLLLLNNFLPLHLQHKILGTKHYLELTKSRRGFYAVLNNRRQKIQDILQKRLQSGYKLGVGEYAAILNFARATWDGNSARIAMRQMLQDQIEPNLKCYNDYFEARCWADTYIPEERHSLRVIPLSEKLRKINSERFARAGNVIHGHQVGEQGIRWEISQLTLKMIEDGIKPDGKTYVHLITALAREGDVTGVKDVLDRVWHIDVGAVLRGERSPTDVPAMRKDSSLYPTEDLLYALAHSFGINNDLNAAIRLVDFFSKTFAIPISQAVWQELLEWAFVLSRPRNGFTGQGGAAAGRLKPSVMEDIWGVMMNTTPKIKPSLLMYDKMIRNHWRRCHFREVLKLMREAVNIFEETLSKSGQSDDIESWVFSENRLFEEMHLGTETVIREQERATNLLSYITIHRWFKLLLSNLRWNFGHPWDDKSSRTYLWQRRLVPELIKEFWKYRANTAISYTIPRKAHVVLRSRAVQYYDRTATVVVPDRKRGLVRMIPETKGQWIFIDEAS